MVMSVPTALTTGPLVVVPEELLEEPEALTT